MEFKNFSTYVLDSGSTVTTILISAFFAHASFSFGDDFMHPDPVKEFPHGAFIEGVWEGESIRMMNPETRKLKLLSTMLEMKCSTYAVAKDEPTPADLHAFCKTKSVAQTGFVQSAANCIFNLSGKSIPVSPIVTCTIKDCEKGAQACRQGRVTADQFKMIHLAKQPSSPIAPSHSEKSSTESGAAK